MTIDHVSLLVPPSKFESIVAWYVATLAPLGYSKQHEYNGQAVGLGPAKDQAKFWIGAKGKEDSNGAGVHIAFRANDNETVDKFHEEGIKAGGQDNGKPGLRMYHPNYYGAFVLDPLGYVFQRCLGT
jgi:catechol 2,3-dioxygenase-like lactoylglutathione lyase family enzyme